MAASFTISPATLALVTSSIAVASLITTYCLFVFVEKLGPAFLPMLSDTFVPAPGNYISRMVLSPCALSIGVLGLAPYFTRRQSAPPMSRKLLLGMSTVASVCLGLVGAVCESTNVPSCMGDTNMHDTVAVIFFVFYDIYMVALSYTPHASIWYHVRLYACVLVSLVSKLRWLPPSYLAALLQPEASPDAAAAPRLAALAAHRSVTTVEISSATPFFDTGLGSTGGPPYLAVAEYADVLSLLIWMATYMQKIGADFEYGIVGGAAEGAARKDAAGSMKASWKRRR